MHRLVRQIARRKKGMVVLFMVGTIVLAAKSDETDKLSQAKTGSFVVVVGNGEPGKAEEKPLSQKVDDRCTISNPFGVEPCSDGSLIITSFDRHSVYRLAADRLTLTRIAGLGSDKLTKPVGQHRGKAIDIELDQPHETRVDEEGNIWVADTRNHRIGKIDNLTLEWTTVAGTGEAGFSGDGGPAHLAQLNGPHSLVLDSKVVYVADLFNHRVRAIDRQTNIISTISGTGEKRLPSEGGLAKDQPLAGPRSLALDAKNLWIALREGNSVWRLNRENLTLNRIAGTGKAGFRGNDGKALDAELTGPKGIAVDPGTGIYIVDTENHQVRKVDLQSGVITDVAGDPRGERGVLARPHGVAWVSSPQPGILVGDSENHQVKFFSSGDRR